MTAPPDPSEVEAVARAPKLPRQARGDMYAILNPWGDFWSPQTFESEAPACEHLAEFAKRCGFTTAGFKVVRVKVRLTLAHRAAAREGGGDG